MAMFFTVVLTGNVETTVDATDLGIDLDNPHELFDVGSRVEFENAHVSGEVTLSASVRINEVEVGAEELADYDADTAISEFVGPYGGVSVLNADFDIENSPTGFDVVEEATDRDMALNVYAALSRAGYDIV